MQPDIATEVAIWLEDLADPVATIERISALGTAASAPLSEYLRRPPNIVPQSRARAVELLGRLVSSEATTRLREVLRIPELVRLPPALRQAESVVKNGAVQQLMHRHYLQRDEDMAFAVTVQRLPAAVAAVGVLGLLELAPTTATLLTDDALADAAVGALVQLGAPGQLAFEREMDNLLDDALHNARARLAVVRAALGLYEMGAALQGALRRKLAAQPHPALRAAAALLDRAAPQRVEALVDGALSEPPALALACLNALPTSGTTTLAPMIAALAEGHHVDLYGDRQPLPHAARRALVLRALESTDKNTELSSRLLAALDAESLTAALPVWVQSRPDRLDVLLRHPRAAVRSAALSALDPRWRSRALRAMLHACIDPDPGVRRLARRLVLRHIGGSVTRSQ